MKARINMEGDIMQDITVGPIETEQARRTP